MKYCSFLNNSLSKYKENVPIINGHKVMQINWLNQQKNLEKDGNIYRRITLSLLLLILLEVNIMNV